MESKILEAAFTTYFNAKPQFLVRAPGRVNLIGEHTDYNEGYVLPMAIDRAVWLALAPRADLRVRIHSLEYQSETVFDLDALTRGTGWQEYIKGVAHTLQLAGAELRGFDAVLTGDIPRGAGLSSSAAVELAAARAFAAVSDIAWDAVRMAQLAQQAENEWVGVNCGIMDQMASAASTAGTALFLDCRSLEIQHAPLPENVAVVILDTSTRRGLVESAYNERRSQCEAAARFFKVKALRDVTVIGDVTGLDTVALKRARHIVTENARVLRAVDAMRAGDVQRLGGLFNASHASLRDDFEVTNAALNSIVECAQAQPACYGARMTGAGFGGCAVALVEQAHTAEFVQAVTELYKQQSGLDASVYICRASAGASCQDVE